MLYKAQFILIINVFNTCWRTESGMLIGWPVPPKLPVDVVNLTLPMTLAVETVVLPVDPELVTANERERGAAKPGIDTWGITTLNNCIQTGLKFQKNYSTCMLCKVGRLATFPCTPVKLMLWTLMLLLLVLRPGLKACNCWWLLFKALATGLLGEDCCCCCSRSSREGRFWLAAILLAPGLSAEGVPATRD